MDCIFENPNEEIKIPLRRQKLTYQVATKFTKKKTSLSIF